MTFCLIFKHEGSQMVGFWEGIAAGISQLSLVEKTKQVRGVVYFPSERQERIDIKRRPLAPVISKANSNAAENNDSFDGD